VRYDPDEELDAKDWLSIDEGERTNLVERYHRREKIEMPNTALHAIIHTVVENQVAMGDSFPAREVLRRLMAEGLTRHEAVHAIGGKLVAHFFNLEKGNSDPAGANQAYVEDLKRLTAEQWRNSGDQPKERRPKMGLRKRRR
jgi:hypothetical protein